MSKRVEELLEEPDSDELFEELAKLSNKTGASQSALLELMLNGFEIKEKKR